MDGLSVTDIGVAGLFIIVVLRQIFDFLGKRNGRDLRECDFKTIAHQVEELHKWHDKDDNEGVKIWYVRKSLEDAITKLAMNIETMTEIFRGMQAEVLATRRDLKSLKGRVENNPS